MNNNFENTDYTFLMDSSGTFNYLDNLPFGWRVAFGAQLCKELKEILIEVGELDTYEVIQIKEKFGELRWYDNSINKKVKEVINKYTQLSKQICARCGAPAVCMTTGWIMPVCKSCLSILNYGEE